MCYRLLGRFFPHDSNEIGTRQLNTCSNYPFTINKLNGQIGGKKIFSPRTREQLLTNKSKNEFTKEKTRVESTGHHSMQDTKGISAEKPLETHSQTSAINNQPWNYKTEIENVGPIQEMNDFHKRNSYSLSSYPKYETKNGRGSSLQSIEEVMETLKKAQSIQSEIASGKSVFRQNSDTVNFTLNSELKLIADNEANQTVLTSNPHYSSPSKEEQHTELKTIRSTPNGENETKIANSEHILERNEMILGEDEENKNKILNDSPKNSESELKQAERSIGQNQDKHVEVKEVYYCEIDKDKQTKPSTSDENEMILENLRSEDNEEIVLCVVEGDNKENLSPIILQSEKCSPSSIDRPASQIVNEENVMDEDKEPAFAEENLDEKKSIIIDNGESSQKSAVKTNIESTEILETQEIVLHQKESSKPIHIISSRGVPNNKTRVEKPSKITEKPRNIPKSRQISPYTLNPGQKEINRKLTTPIRTQIQVSTSPIPKHSSINKKMVKSFGVPEFKSRSPALSKRPPNLQNTNSPMQNKSDEKRKITSQEKKFIFKSRLSQTTIKPSHDYILATPTPRAERSVTAQKPINKPLISAVHKSPSIKPKQIHDSTTKICPEIAARQAEAEKVLLQKKPPVPKFSLNSTQRNGSKSKDKSQSQSISRKPAVPKVNDLLKKKSQIPANL